MKVTTFIDVGAYTGDTITAALRKHPGLAGYYAIEPYAPSCVAMRKKFAGRSDIHIVQAAAGTEEGKTVQLYLFKDIDTSPKFSLANSTYQSKNNVDPNKSVSVKTVNLPALLDALDTGVILKLNAEGAEYELLPYMIEHGQMHYVDKLYCQWHWHKIGLDKVKHDKLVSDLAKLGVTVHTVRELLSV